MTYWQRWMLQPQAVWLRKATFQVHLWSGIGIGLYVLLVSVTGSVLVYRNELYRAATPDPIVVIEQGARLTDEQLRGARDARVSGIHGPDLKPGQESRSSGQHFSGGPSRP